MAETTIHLSKAAHQALKEMAEQTGKTMSEVLEKALDDYRRKLFFEGLAADYAALRADPEAWAEELAERARWDATLMDGLDPDERWTEDGRCVSPEPPKEKTA